MACENISHRVQANCYLFLSSLCKSYRQTEDEKGSSKFVSVGRGGRIHLSFSGESQLVITTAGRPVSRPISRRPIGRPISLLIQSVTYPFRFFSWLISLSFCQLEFKMFFPPPPSSPPKNPELFGFCQTWKQTLLMQCLLLTAEGKGEEQLTQRISRGADSSKQHNDAHKHSSH